MYVCMYIMWVELFRLLDCFDFVMTRFHRWIPFCSYFIHSSCFMLSSELGQPVMPIGYPVFWYSYYTSTSFSDATSSTSHPHRSPPIWSLLLIRLWWALGVWRLATFLVFIIYILYFVRKICIVQPYSHTASSSCTDDTRSRVVFVYIVFPCPLGTCVVYLLPIMYIYLCYGDPFISFPFSTFSCLVFLFAIVLGFGLSTRGL